MRRRSAFPVLLAVSLAPWSIATASDPVGIYAVIDRVVFEPDEKAPERVKLWGAFALAKEDSRDDYKDPEVGYMYFSLPDEKPDAAKKEWADLKDVARDGDVVAFAVRYKPKGKVRKPAEKASAPEPYPLSWGLQKVRKTRDRSPVRELISLALPLSPQGELVPPGSVTLTVRNISDPERKHAKYVFEVKSGSGEVEKSSEIEPGKEKTVWTPSLRLVPGEKYRWIARAVEGDWKGPIAETTFEVKGKG